MILSRRIPFFKMSGSGNDFIIIDNRSGIISSSEGPDAARVFCRPKVSVGADGLILIESPTQSGSDFRWRFYNADGSEAEMCGNGGRCAARFAYVNGIAGQKMAFETLAGLIKAEILDPRVKLEMSRPHGLRVGIKILTNDRARVLHFINTGVPHVICFTPDLDEIDVQGIGRQLRFHEEFQPAGANVNFVNVIDENTIAIRTYERGVEDETLACGTGSVAAAIIASLREGVKSPACVHTRGGESLNVYFKSAPDGMRDVFLEGEAKIIYEGLIREAL